MASCTSGRHLRAADKTDDERVQDGAGGGGGGGIGGEVIVLRGEEIGVRVKVRAKSLV